jgi:hypothetical protein
MSDAFRHVDAARTVGLQAPQRALNASTELNDRSQSREAVASSCDAKHREGR